MAEKDDDLLERAKAHDDSRSKLRTRKPLPVSEPTPVIARPPERVPAAKAKAPIPPGPSKKVLRYEVLEAIRIEQKFQTLKFHPGKVISDELYGPGSIVRFQEAGAKLRLIEE